LNDHNLRELSGISSINLQRYYKLEIFVVQEWQRNPG